MNRPTLSVTICVKNEELLLPRVLSAASAFADEVIVVDTGSTDESLSIVKASDAKLVIFQGENYLDAWNVALAAASSDWVLNLDGDEIVARIDIPELQRLLRIGAVDAYRLRTRNYSVLMDLAYKWHPNCGRYPTLEKWSGCPGYWTSYPLRLFRNKPGVSFRVGETNHTRPDESIEELGWRIEDTEITIHNLGVIKGGDRYLAEKNAARLRGELAHENRSPMDEVNLARTYFYLGEDSLALAHLESALATEPELLDALYIKGLVLKETGDLVGAENSLLDLLAIESDHDDGWTILGMVYQLSGLPYESEGALRRALACRFNHPLAHNSLGVALEDQGRPDLAEASYLKALELHPTLPYARDNLVALYQETGRPELAEKYAALKFGDFNGPVL